MSKNIGSLQEFIAHLADEDTDSEYPFLFRGQPIDKPLVPRLCREKNWRWGEATERRMFEDFKRRSVPYLPIHWLHHNTPWDWLALAQHNGMATRLLDWTSNPLIALWFAVEKPITGDKGIVWYFNSNKDDDVNPVAEIDPFTITRTRVFKPREVSPRITAQCGYFTVHYRTKDEQKHPYGFIPLQKNNKFKDRLHAITIAPQHFGSIRSDLDLYGVNAGTIYPDLGGICRDVEWQHTTLKDEEEI